MLNRPGRWRQLWMMLAIVWTLVVIMLGWTALPRARQVPHDPLFLTELSSQALSILRGAGARAQRVRGAPVWSDEPRIVRMPNGAQLTLPAITTDAQAALVAGEYHQLLEVKAGAQRVPYLLEMLALWLAPLLAAGLVLSLIGNGAWLRRMFANEQRKSRDRATLA